MLIVFDGKYMLRAQIDLFIHTLDHVISFDRVYCFLSVRVFQMVILYLSIFKKDGITQCDYS